MPETRLRAFLSSTSDLAAEREAVAAALPRSFAPYRYEQDRARQASPRDRLRQVLRDTDVFLGILGERYGSVYPDCEGDPSIVEWEFETARAVKGCELMAFRKASLDPARLDPRQQRFLDELSDFEGGTWMKQYASIEELSDDVRDSLLDWLAEFRLRELERREKQRGDVWPHVAGAVAASAVAALMLLTPDAALRIGLLVLALFVASVSWFASPAARFAPDRRTAHGT